MDVFIRSNNIYMRLGFQYLLSGVYRLKSDCGEGDLPPCGYYHRGYCDPFCVIHDLTRSRNVITDINRQMTGGRNVFVVSDLCYGYIVRFFIMKGIVILPESVSLECIKKELTSFSFSGVFSYLRPAIEISHKEKRILLMLNAGFAPGKIANRLGCNVKRVYSHKRKIVEKLELKNRLELYRLLFSGMAQPFMAL